jgi:hypothetical protein
MAVPYFLIKKPKIIKITIEKIDALYDNIPASQIIKTSNILDQYKNYIDNLEHKHKTNYSDIK